MNRLRVVEPIGNLRGNGDDDICGAGAKNHSSAKVDIAGGDKATVSVDVMALGERNGCAGCSLKGNEAVRYVGHLVGEHEYF